MLDVAAQARSRYSWVTSNLDHILAGAVGGNSVSSTSPPPYIISGIVWVEGVDMRTVPDLSTLLQEAFQRGLASAGAPPSIVQIANGRDCGEGTRFMLEVYVSTAQSGSDSPVSSSPEVVHVGKILTLEAHANASHWIMPALAEAADERNFSLRHCRVRLQLDQRFGVGCDTDEQAGVPALPHEESFFRSPFVSRIPPGSMISRSAASFSSPSRSRARAESPTAAFLDANPGLKATVMARAIPLDSELGRAMSKAKDQAFTQHI
mmetsp:Transcript_16279/g.35258  ORF Transcript_16279/g.35258 Transcript_16279/m.35258 type:complete len:264 (-) Transcript_16279:161-952(-)|eukprot:CAMPEP_0206490066 /NCGR_PEP_ID=MMETSP0324_2-20121206/43755_1 /ASSEMBLY_ACC=CAM_ASM_000836 /TAXON_ID=2866 /ORGANISM="Crypthecodinium cohnii, Strain Seligo" /LENGTH=263 /DNA_ID=CAMNT_0053970147 /DNA_START=45 /DNA_END=836 /DNA_ORIENTATION=-